MSQRSCPTPEKRAYVEREAAVFFARADGLRAYKCPCGAYHLSSKQKPGKRMGRV
jgi:hypothetical protein